MPDCPLYIWEFEDDTPLIAVSCPRCREIALYGDASIAARAAVHHAKECGTSKIVIAELLPPDPVPLN